jgi:hypothetical protein
MFRLLAASWLTKRLAGPISRVIPNPFLRAAAIAGAGVLATRVFQGRSAQRGAKSASRRTERRRA